MQKPDREHVDAPDCDTIERYCRDPRLLAGYDPWRDSAGFVFDAQHARADYQWFLDHMTHIRGELGDQPFVLQPWQISFYCNLFSWFEQDGDPIDCRLCGSAHPPRRYRQFGLYVPEGNGKTPLCAGIALRMGEDAEPGFEIYCAAFSIDQAGLLWSWAEGMVRNDASLSANWKIYVSFKSMTRVEDPVSSLKSVASEARAREGVNPHCVMLDEIHTFPLSKSATVDLFESKARKRRQSLVGKLSTAGVSRESICLADWERARKNRDGVDGFRRPHHLPVIYEADKDADWANPKVWQAANPNWGVSVHGDDFRALFEDAQLDPYKEASFRRLKLNQWTEQTVRYFPMADYDKCDSTPVTDNELAGMPIFAGFDGALKDDLTALALVWPDGETYGVRVYFWMPAATAALREKRDNVPYRKWAADGWIELTPGNVVSMAYPERRLEQLRALGIARVNFDPAYVANWAQEAGPRLGMDFVEFPQTATKMNEPTQTLKRLVMSHRIRHGGNPILRWMFANCEARQTANGLEQLVKTNPVLRIDGVVAIIMALAEAMSDAGGGFGSEIL